VRDRRERDSKEAAKENKNNSALVGSTPKKTPSPSSVLRPSPITNANGELKGLTAANDHDAAANDDDAAMVDKVRGILGQLSRANFPEQAINCALSVTDNDPQRAAYFLHSKGESEKTADETDPPPKRVTRSAARPKSSIEGKSIVSDNKTSLMMLREFSLLGPSMTSAAMLDQFVPERGVHWDDSNNDRLKLSMKEKADKAVSVKYGYVHQDHFRREGEEDVTDAELRFRRALRQTGLNEDSRLVQVKPDPFALNASGRCGWFGECADCGKQFPCCDEKSTTEALSFKFKRFTTHKLRCGQDECCCGLNNDQIADGLRRLGKDCSANKVSVHRARCTDADPYDFIQRLDGYQELVGSLVNGMDASEETKNKLLKKYSGLPAQGGLKGMLNELGIDAEKKKEVLKRWPKKVCAYVYIYSYERVKGTRFATEEVKDALERAGLSVKNVVAV
jgi:hypothetical protein